MKKLENIKEFLGDHALEIKTVGAFVLGTAGLVLNYLNKKSVKWETGVVVDKDREKPYSAFTSGINCFGKCTNGSEVFFDSKEEIVEHLTKCLEGIQNESEE